MGGFKLTSLSVKEMFLNEKVHCFRAHKLSTLSTAPRRELISEVVLVVCIRAC